MCIDDICALLLRRDLQYQQQFLQPEHHDYLKHLTLTTFYWRGSTVIMERITREKDLNFESVILWIKILTGFVLCGELVPDDRIGMKLLAEYSVCCEDDKVNNRKIRLIKLTLLFYEHNKTKRQTASIRATV